MTIRVRLLAGLLALTLLAGCTSNTSDDTTSVPAPTPTASRPPSSSSTVPAPPKTIAQLCPAAPTDDAVAACVIGSLNAYWSAALHKHVDGQVMLGYPTKLPTACTISKKDLAALADDAFECPANHTLYFGLLFLRHLHEDNSASGFSDQFAETMGHEEGHLVQDTVHQKQPSHLSVDAGSRFIEQQADCLSGAWAVGIGLASGP